MAKECAEPPSYAVFDICNKDTNSYQFEGYSLLGNNQISSKVSTNRRHAIHNTSNKMDYGI